MHFFYCFHLIALSFSPSALLKSHSRLSISNLNSTSTALNGNQNPAHIETSNPSQLSTPQNSINSTPRPTFLNLHRQQSPHHHLSPPATPNSTSPPPQRPPRTSPIHPSPQPSPPPPSQPHASSPPPSGSPPPSSPLHSANSAQPAR